MNESIVPVIDIEALQKKANEYAMKGAEEALKEFYSGYNSPYKKAIEENLKNKGVDNNFDIPDIIAVLNHKISSEVDAIANTAVAKTFIPLVKDFLIREDSEVRFSDMLKKFIEHTGFDSGDFDVSDYVVIKADRERSASLAETFPVYQITNGKTGFEIHFFVSKEKTTVMSLPYSMDDNRNYYSRGFEAKEKMKLSLDGGATLELPFTRGILENDFVRYCARLVIGNSNIVFDVQDFDEDMFPNRECHC